MSGKRVLTTEVHGPRATIADRIRWMKRALRLAQQSQAEAASMAPSQLSVLLKRETDLVEVQKRIEPLVRAVLADTAGPL